MSNGFSEAGDGAPISLVGTPYAKGLGMAAPAAVIYRLNKKLHQLQRHRRRRRLGARRRARSCLGLGPGRQRRRLDESLHQPDAHRAQRRERRRPMPVAVDVTGMRRLKLMVTNAQDGAAWDRASWGNPQLVCAKREVAAGARCSRPPRFSSGSRGAGRQPRRRRRRRCRALDLAQRPHRGRRAHGAAISRTTSSSTASRCWRGPRWR